MTEAQKCLYHIAENMRMDKSISKEGYEYFQQAIKALEQEPKTGHWIRVDDTKMRCSNCDIIHLIAQYPRVGINYCPNCGCRMFESQESEGE